MHWSTYVIVILAIAFFVYRMMPAKGVKSISPAELKDLLSDKKSKTQFIDVRQPSEFKSGHVNGFKNIPLGHIKNHLGEIDKDRTVVVMCHSGARSMQASKILSKHGFIDVRNLAGGIMKWNANQTK